MTPELGEFALILALCISAVLAVVPLIGTANNNLLWMRFAQPLVKALFICLLTSILCLAYAFATDDFSVSYVANHSNSQLPLRYKISAVWGGHEGSLLLWVFILSGWTLAVSLFSRALPLDMLARVLAVMGMIAFGFSLFTLTTSSPFERYLPEFPPDGADLNPLLQDFGLIVHPPILYMGYVGFSVAFAFAIAALLSGRLDAAWARWSRPWTTIAWSFLGIGITLGSWWAYYELGWGGWWFWDPVENASFMPWLVGTALVHSLAVTEKRGVFKSWTVLLAIFAFSLSLLGTFLVRSGVLTSVHAFASDPRRGFFVLVLLAVTIGGSLTLYAFKAPNVKSESKFTFVSRESFLLLNNIILTVAAVTVLLGTLYPLLVDAMGAGKISVGPPYFNTLFIPQMSLLAIVLGMSVALKWRKTLPRTLLTSLWLPALLSVVFGLLFPLFYHGELRLASALGMVFSLWIFLTSVKDLRSKLITSENLWQRARKLPLGYYGMLLGHLGFAVAIVGVTLVSIYTEERDIRMVAGERQEFAGYRFEFKGVTAVTGPNYTADQGEVVITRNEQAVVTLHPQKRHYTVKASMMTEAAIDPGLFRDLYVAMGEPVGVGAWAIRLHYKPFVRWLWLGGLLTALGGFISVADKRYRRSNAKAMSPELQHV